MQTNEYKFIKPLNCYIVESADMSDNEPVVTIQQFNDSTILP